MGVFPMQHELRRPVVHLSPGPLGDSALAIGGRSSRTDSRLPGHMVGESYTPSLHLPDLPDSISGFSHFAGVTIYVWFIKIRLRAALKVCGCRPAPGKLAWSLQHPVEPNPCNQQRVIYSVPLAPHLNRCQRVANAVGGRH